MWDMSLRSQVSQLKHDGCKRARQCGLTASRCSQANQDFSCVRKMNCCFTHFVRCAANILCVVVRYTMSGGAGGEIWLWSVNLVIPELKPLRKYSHNQSLHSTQERILPSWHQSLGTSTWVHPQEVPREHQLGVQVLMIRSLGWNQPK